MLFRIVYIILWPILKLYLLFKVKNINKLPDKNVIICANHKHFLDPVVLIIATNKKINFMAKKELFENVLLGKFLSKFGVFPVDRGHNDRKAIKKALSVLSEEKILGIFPQGTRIKDEDASRTQFNDGISMLAIRSKKNIVPIRIRGEYKLFSRLTLEIKDEIVVEDYLDSYDNKLELYKAIIDDVYYEIFDEYKKIN